MRKPPSAVLATFWVQSPLGAGICFSGPASAAADWLLLLLPPPQPARARARAAAAGASIDFISSFLQSCPAPGWRPPARAPPRSPRLRAPAIQGRREAPDPPPRAANRRARPESAAATAARRASSPAQSEPALA